MSNVPMTIELPFATPSQNIYQRWHWGRQHKFRDDCVRILLWFLVGKPRQVDKRRRVTVRRYSCGRLDRGNFVGGCKPLIDALVHIGALRDDTEQWLDDRYEQHNAPRGQQRTVIEIEDCA